MKRSRPVKSKESSKRGRPRGENAFRTIKDASVVMGIPIAALQMFRAAGCPAFTSGGRIYRDALDKWMAANPNRVPDASSMIEKLQWEAREKRARAEMREHRLAVARRDFVSVRDVKREFTRAVVDMKKRLIEGMRSNAQEICLHLAATAEQVSWAIQKSEARSRQILTEFSRGEWASPEEKL